MLDTNNTASPDSNQTLLKITDRTKPGGFARFKPNPRAKSRIYKQNPEGEITDSKLNPEGEITGSELNTEGEITDSF